MAGRGEERTGAPGQLAQATLEELMNLEISSVARKEEKLSRTAAAVFVITQDDIRRSGAVSLAEVLRLAPGLHVARLDPGKWAVSARGSNGRFANKMLVLIDGRSIYNPLFSGVYWDQYEILLEDVERIEVIRGPGATTWGANAMNGVINIITKTAAAAAGGLVTALGSAGEGGLFGARYGGRLGRRVSYRVSTRLGRTGGMHRGTAGDEGPLETARGGGRIEWEINSRDSLTVQGDLHQGGGLQDTSESLVSVGVVRPRQERYEFSGGSLQARWRREGERSDMALQWFVNQERRVERVGDMSIQSNDLDFQHRRTLRGRNDLIWGLGYRSMSDRLGGSPQTSFDPPARVTGLASSFIQNDWTVVPDKLVVTAGTKYLYQQYSGGGWQPGVRLSWTPDARRTWWASATKAIRTPSRRDQDVRFSFPLPESLAPAGVVAEYQGTRTFGNERVVSLETGWRQQFGARWSVDAALFRSGYDRLQAIVMGQPEIQLQPFRVLVPLGLTNEQSAVSRGGEVVAQWKPSNRLRASANYSYLSIARQLPSSVFGNQGSADPRHQAQGRITWDVSRRVTFDAFTFWVSRLTDGRIPAYLRADLRLGWQLTRQAELSVGGRNLTDARHQEFMSEDFVLAQQARRSAYVRLVWRF